MDDQSNPMETRSGKEERKAKTKPQRRSRRGFRFFARKSTKARRQSSEVKLVPVVHAGAAQRRDSHTSLNVANNDVASETSTIKRVPLPSYDAPAAPIGKYRSKLAVARVEVLKELLMLERKFSECLDGCVKQYLAPVAGTAPVDDAIKNLSSMHKASSDFVTRMDMAFSSTGFSASRIADYFLSLAKDIVDGYLNYCCEYGSICRYLAQLVSGQQPTAMKTLTEKLNGTPEEIIKTLRQLLASPLNHLATYSQSLQGLMAFTDPNDPDFPTLQQVFIEWDNLQSVATIVRRSQLFNNRKTWTSHRQEPTTPLPTKSVPHPYAVTPTDGIPSSATTDSVGYQPLVPRNIQTYTAMSPTGTGSKTGSNKALYFPIVSQSLPQGEEYSIPSTTQPLLSVSNPDVSLDPFALAAQESTGASPSSPERDVQRDHPSPPILELQSLRLPNPASPMKPATEEKRVFQNRKKEATSQPLLERSAEGKRMTYENVRSKKESTGNETLTTTAVTVTKEVVEARERRQIT